MELEELRAQLDEIDRTLEENFIKRMEVVARIGAFKEQHGLPTLDAGREAQVLEKHTAGLDEELRPFMEAYFTEMMALSRKYQDMLKLKKGTQLEENA